MNFFDDFDWDDMAMAGGLSEEMAEEERQRRRLEREVENTCGDDASDDADDDDDDYRHSFIGRGPAVKGPFEQFVDDHIHGRKLLGDPMLGPSRSIKGSAANRSLILGVPIYNAHLVSEKFLGFVYLALKANPGHRLRAVYFESDDTPKVEEQPVFGIFNADNRTIHINLQKHLHNALRLTEARVNGFSIRHTLAHSMQTTLLHEIKHALDTAKGDDVLNLDKSEQDRIASAWAVEVLTLLAIHCDVEPADLSEEPFFGATIISHIDRAIETGDWIWAKNQKKMLAHGIHYQDASFTIYSEKEYYTLSYAGIKGDERGKQLNAQIRLGIQYLYQEWARIEKNINILEKAVDSGTRLLINYAFSEGVTDSVTILPTGIFQLGAFPWIFSLYDADDRSAAFRADKIIDISLP